MFNLSWCWIRGVLRHWLTGEGTSRSMEMKRSAAAVLTISIVPAGHCAAAGEERPGYVSVDKLPTLLPRSALIRVPTLR